MKLLSSEERATVVAAVLSGACDPQAILSRLAVPSAKRCAEAVAALATLDRDKRVRALVSEVGTLTTMPGQLRRVHESWIEHCLGDAGQLGKLALSTDGEASTQIQWLQHALFGSLVSMTCDDDGVFEALLVRDAHAIVAAMTTLGRRRLAQAVRAAPKEAAAALAAKLGPEHGSRFLAESGQPMAGEQIRRAVKELADLMRELSSAGHSVAELLFRAGSRFVGAALLVRGGDCNRQLAQRMPMARGRLLLREVERLKDAEARLDRAEADTRLAALAEALA